MPEPLVSPLPPTGIDAALFDTLAEAYRKRWDARLLACRADGRIVLGEPARSDTEACAVRELAIREALRWGDPTFELGDDVLIWAVPLMHNAELLGGLVATLPGRRAFGRDGRPRLDLRRAAHELREAAERANLTNAALLSAHRQAEGHARHWAETLHALKRRPSYDLRQVYLLEEPALAEAIRQGHRGDAREILNRLLVGIHHAAGDDLDAIKSLYVELVTTVSRTAIRAGGAPEPLLAANLEGLQRLAAVADQEALAHWLRDVLEQAMDLVDHSRRRDPAALLADALHYMEQHCTERLSRDAVARACCVSPAHFSRRLRQHSGRTFTELLTQMRLTRAAAMLRQTDKPIGLIALDCGFGDHSYFTKVFRRAKAMTPQEWRDRSRNQ